MNIRVTRLANGPIIGSDLHPSIGTNIQGPSLILVPNWIEDRLGAHYLYFADHKGSYIRLAYADHLAGPWRVHPSGSLHLAQSGFLTAPPTVSPDELARFEAQYRARGVTISHDVLSEITTPHIASPDVHVDAERRRIVMYFHGLDGVGRQVSRVAISQNRPARGDRPLLHAHLSARRHDLRTHHVRYPVALGGRAERFRDGTDAVQS